MCCFLLCCIIFPFCSSHTHTFSYLLITRSHHFQTLPRSTFFVFAAHGHLSCSSVLLPLACLLHTKIFHTPQASSPIAYVVFHHSPRSSALVPYTQKFHLLDYSSINSSVSSVYLLLVFPSS